MLKTLTLHAFKCFENLSLPLAPLTLLSGTNSGGKSTILQAVVLLSQTMNAREWGSVLLLNGSDLSLGTTADVINQRIGGREVQLGISTGEESVDWVMGSKDRRAPFMDVQRVAVREHNVDGVNLNDLKCDDPEKFRWLLPPEFASRSRISSTLRQLTWLSAERSGPREVLPLLDPIAHRRVGPRGELAAGTLYWSWNEDDEYRISEGLRLNEVPPLLFHQVQAWMRSFFPGSDLKVTPVDGASAITLQLRNESSTSFHRPQNVGFGLTQLLPILVAVLNARPGAVLLIENPEVHLHPRAQQEIGTFLARAAASGVQIILETHSDHVLNGIRLAVKDQVIHRQQVAMHFFSSRNQTDRPAFSPISPLIDADGRLDQWPEGFFDQFDQALAALL